MTTKSEMIDLGIQFGLINEKYERASYAYVSRFEPISDEDFWLLLAKFQDDISRRLKQNLDAAKYGCDEFVRSLCHDQCNKTVPKKFRPVDADGQYTQGDDMKGWELAAGFAAKYVKIVNKISKALNGVDMSRGDDGFGDFCDSFPLAGKEAFDKLTSAHRPTCAEVEALVPSEWQKFVCHGENYVASTLANELGRRFAYIASQSARREQMEKEEAEREERWRKEREAKKAAK